MKKKTNWTMRSAAFMISTLLVAGSYVSTPKVACADEQEVSERELPTKVYAKLANLKLLKEIAGMQNGGNSVRIWNNMHEFLMLSEHVDKNPEVQKALQDWLDRENSVSVNKHGIPCKLSRRIPKAGEYNLDVALPQGTIPSLIASFPAETRMKAMLFKIAKLGSHFIAVKVTQPFDAEPDIQEEYVGNILASSPGFGRFIGDVFAGDYLKAFRSCRMQFTPASDQAIFAFHFILPKN